MRSVCHEEPTYGEHEGKSYCVLHLPREGKNPAFNEAFQRKIQKQDFDFRGVWFPDYLTLSDSHVNTADFSYATFNAPVSLKGPFNNCPSFSWATFCKGAYFNGAQFGAGAAFRNTTFMAGANFSEAIFEGRADFSHANFHGEVDFRVATFNGEAKFEGTTFKEHVRFGGDEQHSVFTATSSLNLGSARIEKLDRVSFDRLRLCPHWFVNVDARKFAFTDVNWDWPSTEQEIAKLKAKRNSSRSSMLETACRRLAVNAEENHYYEDASELRYLAMEAKRFKHGRGYDFWRLSWWYWLASGYGERVNLAALVLIEILLLCAVLYTQVGFVRSEPRLTTQSDVETPKRDEIGAPIKEFPRALAYSAAVMTFQRPEPRPATIAAHTIVLLETILGPVQVALLALAIRRKFMR